MRAVFSNVRRIHLCCCCNVLSVDFFICGCFRFSGHHIKHDGLVSQNSRSRVNNRGSCSENSTPESTEILNQSVEQVVVNFVSLKELVSSHAFWARRKSCKRIHGVGNKCSAKGLHVLTGLNCRYLTKSCGNSCAAVNECRNRVIVTVKVC